MPVKTDEDALGDGLMEMMNLAMKYDFSIEDTTLLGDRLLLLGEAMTLIQDMGVYEELIERHQKACEIAKKFLTTGDFHD